MKMNSAHFKCRVWLSPETVEHREVWDHQLTPIDTSRIPVREWVELHLDDWNTETYYERFELDKEKNFEVVFSGKIEASYNEFTMEHDEEIDILEYSVQELPSDWPRF